MKILYAIQGTGNGHISRARDIIPILQRKGDLDLLISGIQSDVDLPYPIKYRFRGLSFIFGKTGSIDLWATYRKANLKNLFTEINLLPVERYDLVINDFEPVSAWACYLKNKRCFSLSHQCAVLNKNSPKPDKFDLIGKTILKNYAPVTSKYGFHFQSYAEKIFTPVIRQQVRNLTADTKGHYTAYLPAYSDKRIISILSQLEKVTWQVFSKHSSQAYKDGHISVFPITNDAFVKSLAGAEGVLCGAGFETPAEVLFLGKKLMVIPMKRQFEQQCNAAALKEMGVPVIKSLKEKYLPIIRQWLSTAPTITVKYPDITEQIIDALLDEHRTSFNHSQIIPGKRAYSVKELRKLSLKKILLQLAS
jgi:uncharacterized protein (TIGR00661 family)